MAFITSPSTLCAHGKGRDVQGQTQIIIQFDALHATAGPGFAPAVRVRVHTYFMYRLVPFWPVRSSHQGLAGTYTHCSCSSLRVVAGHYIAVAGHC